MYMISYTYSCTPWTQSAGSPQDVRPPLTPATRPPPCVGRNVRTIHWWMILKLPDKAGQRIQWPSLSRCAATMPKIIVIMRIRRSIVIIVIMRIRRSILRASGNAPATMLDQPPYSSLSLYICHEIVLIMISLWYHDRTWYSNVYDII